jgi:hypothetical protein
MIVALVDRNNNDRRRFWTQCGLWRIAAKELVASNVPTLYEIRFLPFTQ